ncbi:hypothetical protein EYF80_012249 [Liparis tanakae]|uniref:Uncharacterized protein n=1 Tax=Liparis tanakae TaxID=230148 RepID=A0A4Z2IIA9_9TELE|nr:hypothetical protein EYF80_012249 [Liparis tanakae]
MLSVQRKIPMVEHVYSLLNMVWKTYHYSSKSMRELRALGEELGVHVNVPDDGSSLATTRAVRSFKILNHDSWPEQILTDYGAEELDFLLDHFSPILTRNGCDTKLAREEYQSMKMFIATNYMDKSYHALWGMMLTKMPFCSDYKLSFQLKPDCK